MFTNASSPPAAAVVVLFAKAHKKLRKCLLLDSACVSEFAKSGEKGLNNEQKLLVSLLYTVLLLKLRQNVGESRNVYYVCIY